MKYAANLYAQAYLQTKADPSQFLHIVEKNGDFSRIDKILQAIEELATKEAGGHMIHLEFARDLPAQAGSDMAKKFKFTTKDHVRVSINPSLVAGVRVTIDGTKEFDNSFKRKINTLFV
ncbi:MAG: F0F1 ATP synthase subunit delta [Patescibacteria group bacterium]